MRERIRAADGPTERIISCVDVSGGLLPDAEGDFDIQYSVATRETRSFCHRLAMRASRAALLERNSDRMYFTHQLPYHTTRCREHANLLKHWPHIRYLSGMVMKMIAHLRLVQRMQGYSESVRESRDSPLLLTPERQLFQSKALLHLVDTSLSNSRRAS